MPGSQLPEPGAGEAAGRAAAPPPLRFRRPPDALWHRTSRRTVVSPAPGADTVELRDIPALVWEGLDQPVSLDELVGDLAAVFDRTEDAIRDEVRELVTWMVTAGLARAG